MHGSLTRPLAVRQAASQLGLALSSLIVAALLLVQTSSAAVSRPLDDVIASKKIRIYDHHQLVIC